MSLFKKFLFETTGSIVPATAILMVPLVITIGAVVDYTNYNNIKNEVQTAIDSAGIAAAREFVNYKPPEGMTDPAEIQKDKVEFLKNYAQTFLKANLGSSVSESDYTFDLTLQPDPINRLKDRIKISSTITYDTIFGGKDGKDGGILLKKDEISASLGTVIQLGNRTVEIALVLDNSGSMAFKSGNTNANQSIPASPGERRIDLLEKEALKLVDNIYLATKGSQLPKPVQFSIVPFSSSINVGKIGHSNYNNGNSFLDTKGYAPSHHENFDWVNTYRTKSGESISLENNRAVVLNKSDGSKKYMSRLDVFSMMGLEWEGCVEMRPWPHNTQDTFYDATTSYSSQRAPELFVPYLVPDSPDSIIFDHFRTDDNQIRYVYDDPPSGSRTYSNNYLQDFWDYDANRTLANPRFRQDDVFGPGEITNVWASRQLERTNWLWKYQAVLGDNASLIDSSGLNSNKRRDLKKLLPKMVKPYSNKNTTLTNGNYFRDSGPNAFCPDQTIVQLTEDKAKIQTELKNMEAHGGTNIQQGLTWGWRTLSPAKPFDGGRPIEKEDNLKIMILLTDGNNQTATENTPNKTQYNAWGFQRKSGALKNPVTNVDTHRRMLGGVSDTADTIYASEFSLDTTPDNQSEYEDLMNLHTNQACNNIKNAGVTIISIAFDVPPNDTTRPERNKVRRLLEQCSGSGKVAGEEVVYGIKYYHDVKGAELQDTFEEIAEAISAIRIAQ